MSGQRKWWRPRPPAEQSVPAGHVVVNLGGLVAEIADAYKAFADTLTEGGSVADTQATLYRLATHHARLALVAQHVHFVVPETPGGS